MTPYVMDLRLMSDTHWAVFALRDIQNALDENRYDVASCHINDAIEAILARDAQDHESSGVAIGDMAKSASKF